MKGSYLEPHEMQQLEFLLKYSLQDTLNCWVSTRIDGCSASMVSEGNVCVPLLRGFDVVAAAIDAARKS
jgi:hypothetical protein